MDMYMNMKRYDIPCWVRGVSQVSHLFLHSWPDFAAFAFYPSTVNITGLVMLEEPSLPLAFIPCLLAFVHETISSCLGQCFALMES